jgi:hypothetical protein
MDKLQQHTSDMLADMAVQSRRSAFVKAELGRDAERQQARPLRALALESTSRLALIKASQTVLRGSARA